MKKIAFFILSFSFISCFAVDNEIWIQNLIANELAKKWIITKQDHLGKYNTEAKISRAELVGIALKLKGTALPSNYSCKKYFEDVTKNDWVCRSTEIAADLGIITRGNKKFRPNDLVTYTEGLSILYRASGLKPTGQEKPDFITSLSLLDWQKKVLYDVYNTTGLTFPGRNFYVNYSEYLLRWAAFEFSGVLLNALDIKNNAKKVTFKVLSLEDWADEIIIQDGKENIVVSTGGSVISPIIINGFLVYEWWSTGWFQKIVYDIQKRRHVLTALWEDNVSSDGKVVYDCFSINGYSLFSFETQKVLHRYRSTTIPEIKEVWPPPQMCYYSAKNNGTLIYKDGTKYILDEEWKNPLNVLDTYYHYLSWIRFPEYIRIVYDMRVGNSESFETFKSWYDDVEGNLRINSEIIKNLGDNVYEFMVEEIDEQVTSRYRVKSKVNVENFTIENISSVKI